MAMIHIFEIILLAIYCNAGKKRMISTCRLQPLIKRFLRSIAYLLSENGWIRQTLTMEAAKLTDAEILIVTAAKWNSRDRLFIDGPLKNSSM